MCNYVTDEAKTDIKRSGYAYKVFGGSIKRLTPVIHCTSHYTVDIDGWVRWKSRFNAGEGFCLFPTKRMAQLWAISDQPIIKVKYRNALGRQTYLVDCNVCQLEALIVTEFEMPIVNADIIKPFKGYLV